MILSFIVVYLHHQLNETTMTTITFKKVNTLAGKVFTTTVELTLCVSPKGKEVRRVNQVDTANTVIDEAATKYEDGKLSFEEMAEVIKSQEYSQYIS